MRSSESPLASLLCPDSVGHPSLPLLLLALLQSRRNLKLSTKFKLNCGSSKRKNIEEVKKIKKNLCVELDLLFDFSVPHAGGCRKLGFIL